MDWAMRSASAMSRARAGSVAASAPATCGERDGLQVVVGDGLGEAFRAVRVGGCQCPRDVGEREAFRSSSVMDWARRSARPGSVAASAPATWRARWPSGSRSVMDWARRSARSGSVAASAPAMSASAQAFRSSSVMDWAMRSASAMSRARSGSVAASAPAMLASALAFR